ncbi:hypothetical protein CSOJ01_15019 [Colletotrichum sojae]|uniref:Uncharacterized protein n=1 Tax=Colletotrichum sojae TaxID=2175907 RepID=A0A8H6IP86_9PEZI|nr:hypothetical protein CSOJ01_15019 [Colletotrichum sojae]
MRFTRRRRRSRDGLPGLGNRPRDVEETHIPRPVEASLMNCTTIAVSRLHQPGTRVVIVAGVIRQYGPREAHREPNAIQRHQLHETDMEKRLDRAPPRAGGTAWET